MRNRKRNNELIILADKALHESESTILNANEKILDSYNSLIAAFSVSVAMSGLLPTLAGYYKKSNNANTDRRPILDIITYMIQHDEKANSYIKNEVTSAKTLLQLAVKLSSETADNNELPDLRCLEREVIDCAIALKQVVRTYNLVEKL